MSTKRHHPTRRSGKSSAGNAAAAKSNQTPAGLIEDTSELARANEQLKAEMARLKELKKGLQQSESQLRLVLENTSDGINIAEFDPQTGKRRLVMCNDRYVEMSGRSREELMEADDLNQFARQITIHGSPFLEQTLNNQPSEGMSSWLRPDGKENYYEWTATPLKVGEKFHIIGIDRDVTGREQARELKAANRRLEELAHTDELTGLPNRRRLIETLENELQRVRRYGGNLAVAMLDVDRFKALNDTYGHLLGDNSLVRLATLLRSEAREVDTAARYGGDEFILLMPSTTAEGAVSVIRRIQEKLAQHTISDGRQDVTITFSGGVSEADASSVTTLENVLRTADEALYAAKGAGRNCTKIWQHIGRNDATVDDNLAVA